MGRHCYGASLDHGGGGASALKEVPCDNCKTPTPAAALRPWLQYNDVELRHLPGRSAQIEMRLCPECHAAAQEDERRAFAPSRRLGLVLGGLFILILVTTFAAPGVWPTLARWIYGSSQKELVYQRSMDSSNPTPWSGHSFSTPTSNPPAPAPAAP